MPVFSKYASVVLDLSIDKVLDYGIPDELLPKLSRGSRVEVPVRGRPCTGYVFSVKDSPDYPKVLPVSKLLGDMELINDNLFELALWMARYYCSPLRQVFKTILPASIRNEGKSKQQLFVMRGKPRDQLMEYCREIRTKHPAQAAVLDVMLQVKKGILLSELLEQTQGSRSPVDTLAKNGLLLLDIVRIDRSPLINEQYIQTKPKPLNQDQSEALNKIQTTLDSSLFATHLLYGVTGSGKTEVYLQAIEKALAMGKSTIMLVPEISLTGQTIERFRSRFEGHIAVLHHRLSHGERFDEWHKIRRGDAKIVIGARSAVFSPATNLGLIIVDEEHEHSYKQGEESPFYNARDVAVMRGKMANAAVILGSATPCLESYYNAQVGKYVLSKLRCRADAAAIPRVVIVDMKVEYQKAKGFTNFSGALLDRMKQRFERGEQTILFLNRRGYHTTLLCRHCGKAMQCLHCDVSLTFHRGDGSLACHLCGYRIAPPPSECLFCRSSSTLKYKGVGTEQIERALHAIFPDIRTLRMDADTTRHKGSHQRLLRDFGTGKADVLIGTQMIAKGLHFPQVTLVGIVNSDASLNLPDFRASETAFQLITQVSGRAGRGSIPGEVVLQTCLPENQTISHAGEQNYEKFYAEEIAVRQLFRYPPFTQMAKLAFAGVDQVDTLEAAESIRGELMRHLSDNYELNAVVPSGYARVKGKYRYQFLVRGPSIYPISRALEAIQRTMPLPSRLKMSIDINPASTYF